MNETDHCRLTRLSFKGPGKPVEIKYDVQTEKGAWDNYAMASNEAPLPELPEALAALADSVASLCEIKPDPKRPIKVIGVTLTYDDDGNMGACITGLRTLTKSASPLVLNTPHRQAVPVTDDSPALDDNTIKLLRLVEQVAFRYLDGHRAQPDLFEDEMPSVVDFRKAVAR